MSRRRGKSSFAVDIIFFILWLCFFVSCAIDVGRKRAPSAQGGRQTGDAGRVVGGSANPHFHIIALQACGQNGVLSESIGSEEKAACLIGRDSGSEKWPGLDRRLCAAWVCFCARRHVYRAFLNPHSEFECGFLFGNGCVLRAASTSLWMMEIKEYSVAK